MKTSKSERTKKIVQTDDKRLFYTTINIPSEDSASQVPNKRQESLHNSPSSEQKQMQKQPSYEYKIGNYLIQQTLGEGTFGKVKLGIYLPNDEKVAIKVLEKDRMTDKDDQIRVKREFDMLSRFNHPNVILVTEIFESIDSYYSVMEYCEGGELFNYIVKKRRLTEKETSFFYFQIINGLEYIHSLGIVHRDLKPENLLLTKDHLLKIIDFGLSNYFEENQTELLSTPCGSPCYASPEMVAGKKYDGIKIDVWSTGIILFAMLCGYLPFEDKNNDILFDKILECNLEFPEFLSEESKDLISKILVVDPDKRITIPQIKQHSFFIKGKKLFNDVFTIKPVDDIPLDNPDYKEEENNDENIKNENVENAEEEINHKESKNESKINTEIKDENDLTENKENINIENFQNNENNISSINNNQVTTNEKNNDKNIRNKNLKNYEKGFILNDNDSKKSKKDKAEEIKDNNNNKQKLIKTNKKLKELNNKYFHLVEKKNNHKKVNITDNNPNDDEIIIKNSKNKKLNEPNKRNKINRIPIHKTPEIKNGKIMRLKEKVNIDKNKNNLILDSMTKDRNTIGSIASIGSSVVETINNISQQTNTTNNINYNVNISFEHTKRTYSHENTKDSTQNEQSTKNYINKISNNNLTNTSNSHNINIIDNNNYKENKYFKNRVNDNNYLFNHFNYHNKNDKRKNNPSKIKKNLKDPRTDKHYYNSDNIKLPREEIDFNICKLINDSIIKKNYKEFLYKKYGDNNNSKSKNKDNHIYTNRTNCINSNKNTNVSNNKDNNNISIDNNKSKNKNYMKKIQNNKNINPREISTRDKSSNKNKNLSTINNNNNSKSRYKKLMIKPSNLLNKTIENNNKKKVNKLQYNTLINQNSVDEEQNPINMQTEPNKAINKLTKNNKIKNIKTTPNLENKKFSQNLKHNNTQQKPFREKIDLSLKKGKIGQRWTKYNPINQVLNISNKKNFETINTNFNLYKPDINSHNINKNLQKNITKPKTSHNHIKKKEIPNKIIEKASKSIEIKNDKNELFKQENYKDIHIEKNNNNIKSEKHNNNIKPVNNYNISNNENHTNYIKITDRSQNQSNSKSKDEYIYKNKENKENIKANIEISLNIEHDLYQAKNKLLKMNKFRNICLNNNNNDETIDLKNNDFNNNKKSHIRTIKIITKLNNQRDNLFKIQKNKTLNNMSNKINHIISHSSKIHNNNSYLIGKNIDHNKLNSMRLTDIYKNNIKNKNKLKKVYLIDKNKKNRKYSNESKRNNKSKNKGILHNPAVFQKQNVSTKNCDNSKDKQRK